MFNKGRWKGIWLIMPLVGFVAFLSACSAGAPATPTPAAVGHKVMVYGAPALALDKFKVDLGNISQDQQGMATFLVNNMGDMLLRVDKVDFQIVQGCDAVETVKMSIEIKPEEAVLLPLKLGPHQQIGPHQILVNIRSNDPSEPIAAASVSFNVTEAKVASTAAPHLRVDKEVIDIGAVPYSWPLYEQFILQNDGAAPLVLQGIPQVRVEEGC